MPDSASLIRPCIIPPVQRKSAGFFCGRWAGGLGFGVLPGGGVFCGGGVFSKSENGKSRGGGVWGGVCVGGGVPQKKGVFFFWLWGGKKKNVGGGGGLLGGVSKKKFCINKKREEWVWGLFESNKIFFLRICV